MAPPSGQIVPSKNALRALRKLALGGSTIVGAVGSISGLAFVSYDVRQRIHLAESVVATKRVLHSQPISNTNRKAHMATMFEMYERGEGKEGSESWQDFSQRARRQSAHLQSSVDLNQGAMSIEQNTILNSDERKITRTITSGAGSHNSFDDSQPRSTLPDSATEPARVGFKERQSNRPGENSPRAKQIIAATRRPFKFDSHAVYGRPREAHHVSPVQKIIIATQQQHKLKTHAVFGRPPKSKDDALPRLASCVRQWLAPGVHSKQESVHIRTPKRPDMQRKSTWTQSLPRHHSTLADDLRIDNGDLALWPSGPADDGYIDPLSADSTWQSDKVAYGHKINISLKPVNVAQVDTSSEIVVPQNIRDTRTEDRNAEKSIMADITTLISERLYQAHRDAVMTCEMEQPVYDLSSFNTHLPSSAAEIGDDGLSKIAPKTARICSASAIGSNISKGNTEIECETLLQRLIAAICVVQSKEGKLAARDFTTEAMFIYADGGTPIDLRAIDQLQMRFSGTLRLNNHIRPRYQLIHYLLNTGVEADFERAGQLLFNWRLQDVALDDHASSVLISRHKRDAKVYIDWLCGTHEPSFAVAVDFRKVLELALQQGTSPSESLFYHMLQRFQIRGELKYLRNMFDEMVTSYGVEAGALTRTILLLGYAQASDWDQIATEFAAMHRDGFSRKEPISYALMFDKVFHQYAASEPIEKVHDFLVNATLYWGLVPVSRVSATAVQAYIRHKRYDLIKEWIEATAQLWPNLNTSGNILALTLAKTWTEIGASCQEIEEACVSIFRGHKNFIPGRLRATVQEALATDLARKIHSAILDEEPVGGQLCEVDESQDLSAQLQSAFTLILKHAGESGVITQSSVAELLAQSSAALRLGELFGAAVIGTVPKVEVSPQVDRPARRQVVLSKQPISAPVIPIPDVLRQKVLPDRESVMSLVSSYYSQRLQLGEHTSHDILKMTCRQLDLGHRRQDVLLLIVHIYNGPAVHGAGGVMFDLEVFQTWLEAAYRLKSALACRQVLQNLLERGSTIRLTSQFMLLARMATHKAFGMKYAHRHKMDVAVSQELQSLLDLLTDRFYAQRKNTDRKSGRKYNRLLTFCEDKVTSRLNGRGKGLVQLNTADEITNHRKDGAS